jgi:hypothetical protein
MRAFTRIMISMKRCERGNAEIASRSPEIGGGAQARFKRFGTSYCEMHSTLMRVATARSFARVMYESFHAYHDFDELG